MSKVSVVGRAAEHQPDPAYTILLIPVWPYSIRVPNVPKPIVVLVKKTNE